MLQNLHITVQPAAHAVFTAAADVEQLVSPSPIDTDTYILTPNLHFSDDTVLEMLLNTIKHRAFGSGDVCKHLYNP